MPSPPCDAMAQSLLILPINSGDMFPLSIENFAAMPHLKKVINIDTLTPMHGNVHPKQHAGQKDAHLSRGLLSLLNSQRNNGAPNRLGMNFQNMT